MNKNKLLAFFFSFIPGCGLMYLGYMKKGLQAMLMFALSIFFAIMFSDYRFGPMWMITLVFSLLMPVIWIYQFFDSMHTFARMKKLEIEYPIDDGFYIPDNFLAFLPNVNRTTARVIGFLLIVFGSLAIAFNLLDNLSYLIQNDMMNQIVSIVRRYLVSTLFSFGLIVAGLRLLRGNKAAPPRPVLPEYNANAGKDE